MSNGHNEPNFPNFLYRYRSCDTEYFGEELDRAVRKGEQFFSCVAAANDPFDCNPVYSPSSDRDIFQFHKKLRKKFLVSENSNALAHLEPRERRRILKRKFAASYDNIKRNRNIFDEIPNMIRQESKIICLSEEWNNPLLWAHYGCGHNGVAIKFKVDIGAAEITSDDIPLNVMYFDERPRVSTLELIAWMNAERGGPELEALSDRAFQSFVLSKPRVWEYEKEWRIQKRFQGGNGYRYVPALQAVEVIVGVRVDGPMLEKIKQVCHGKVSVRRAEIDANEFTLVLND